MDAPRHNSEHIYIHILARPFFSAALNLSSISTFLTNPSISFVRVRNSEIHLHSPVKVIKPDWGHSISTVAFSEANLKAT
jgi:hypothetical protein